MSYIEVFLIGIGLSMDAFAVCATNAVVYKNTDKKRGFIMAVCFGVFQAVMPTIGYFRKCIFRLYKGSRSYNRFDTACVYRCKNDN